MKAESPSLPDLHSEQKTVSPKPTPEQVEQIKTLHAAGKKPGEIAKAVGLHHLAVWGILKPKKAA
jgi:DNA invertase Pin-like site-specific DNA recombinase